MVLQLKIADPRKPPAENARILPPWPICYSMAPGFVIVQTRMSMQNNTVPPPRRRIRFHPRHRRRARRGKEISANPHALSAGAERLSAHRPRQKHLPELRHRARIRRHLQSADGRHQPDQGRRRIRGFHHRGRELAHRRLGGRPARFEAARQDAGNAKPPTANRDFDLAADFWHFGSGTANMTT